MDIATYIHDKHVAGTLAEDLLSLSPADRQAVERVLQEVSPSANTLRSYLQLAQEIAARDSASIAEVLDTTGLRKAVDREGVSRKEKQKLVRQELEALRYPMVAKLQARLHQSVATLRKECGLRFVLPKDLEGDSVEIRVSARSADDLRTLAKQFEQAAECEATGELFRVLRGEF